MKHSSLAKQLTVCAVLLTQLASPLKAAPVDFSIADCEASIARLHQHLNAMDKSTNKWMIPNIISPLSIVGTHYTHKNVSAISKEIQYLEGQGQDNLKPLLQDLKAQVTIMEEKKWKACKVAFAAPLIGIAVALSASMIMGIGVGATLGNDKVEEWAPQMQAGAQGLLVGTIVTLNMKMKREVNDRSQKMRDTLNAWKTA